jgi:protein-S-isoprenylcysteine O-methyltransferase Ste14
MTLKKHFTYTVTNIENNELIEKGFYKIIRHPGYLGQLIIFLGISISLSNWLSIISMIVPVIIGFIYRINIEEKFMLKQMGTEYKDYQDRTNK